MSIKNVAIALFTADRGTTRLLMLQSCKDNKWVIPGGMIDAKDAPYKDSKGKPRPRGHDQMITAILREFEEEVGQELPQDVQMTTFFDYHGHTRIYIGYTKERIGFKKNKEMCLNHFVRFENLQASDFKQFNVGAGADGTTTLLVKDYVAKSLKDMYTKHKPYIDSLQGK